MATSKMLTATSVLFFYPNIIGYLRILFTMISFFLMIARPKQWTWAVSLYLASFVGDLIDGWVARKFDQTSTFGGVLDMVTDRCATLGLLFILAGDYSEVDVQLPLPLYRMTFLLLAFLDISSHWIQMYSTLSIGLHHKSEEANLKKNFLVRWFYKYYLFFGYLCVGAELTYVLLYIRPKLSSSENNFVWVNFALCICIPGCFAKQLVNFAQLASASYAIANHDARIMNQGKVS